MLLSLAENYPNPPKMSNKRAVNHKGWFFLTLNGQRKFKNPNPKPDS